MLLISTEMYIQLMQVLQKGSKRCTLCHLGKSIDILREALATITKLAVRTGNVGMSVVDIAGQQHASMHLTPVSTHLLAILTTSVEVGHLIGTKDVVHIFGQFCLQWSHDSKLFAYENLGKQVLCSGEHHRLLAEVLNEGALGQELWHIAHLVTGLLGEALTGAWENGSTNKYGYIRKVCDKLPHKGQILCTIVLSRYVDLQECNVNVTQVIIVPLVRVADEQFTLWVVVFQPIFEGSAYEATSIIVANIFNEKSILSLRLAVSNCIIL